MIDCWTNSSKASAKVAKEEAPSEFCIRNIQDRIGSILTWSAFARAEAQLGSSIGNEPGEALVHVILVMAVEERRSGVVRDEIDLRGSIEAC